MRNEEEITIKLRVDLCSTNIDYAKSEFIKSLKTHLVGQRVNEYWHFDKDRNIPLYQAGVSYSCQILQVD